jgi:hypothetical protein
MDCGVGSMYGLEAGQFLCEIGGLQVGVVPLVGEVGTKDGPHDGLRRLYGSLRRRILGWNANNYSVVFVFF